MKEIKLTQGKVALVDDADFEELNQFKWCANKSGRTFYAERAVRVNGKQIKLYLHRVILKATPSDPAIDHEDGDGLNCQRYNIRFCTLIQNSHNRKPNKNCSSVFKGIFKVKNTDKYRCVINIDKKGIHLGYFTDEIEAAKAYDKAAKLHFKEFAYLNFPQKEVV